MDHDSDSDSGYNLVICHKENKSKYVIDHDQSIWM